MTVVLDLANGNTETFATENYVISRTKDFRPMICRVTVFDNGRRIARRKRFCIWWYKKIHIQKRICSKQTERIEW